MKRLRRLVTTTLGLLMMAGMVLAGPTRAYAHAGPYAHDWHYYYNHAMGNLRLADRLLLQSSNHVWPTELQVDQQIHRIINDERYPPVSNFGLAFRTVPNVASQTGRMQEIDHLLRSARRDFQNVAARGSMLLWSERPIGILNKTIADHEQAMAIAHVPVPAVPLY